MKGTLIRDFDILGVQDEIDMDLKLTVGIEAMSYSKAIKETIDSYENNMYQEMLDWNDINPKLKIKKFKGTIRYSIRDGLIEGNWRQGFYFNMLITFHNNSTLLLYKEDHKGAKTCYENMHGKEYLGDIEEIEMLKIVSGKGILNVLFKLVDKDKLKY